MGSLPLAPINTSTLVLVMVVGVAVQRRPVSATTSDWAKFCVQVGASGTYTVPLNNPFVGDSDMLPEIWAYGLRNPWRFSFDRTTGDLYIGDVGQNKYEEIDFQPSLSLGGENYGRDCREGLHDFESVGCPSTGFVDPVQEYGRNLGCSVTGGVVYRGRVFPRMQGIYFYGDYCTGCIWGLIRGADNGWQNQQLIDSKLLISSFGEDEAGNIICCRTWGINLRD